MMMLQGVTPTANYLKFTALQDSSSVSLVEYGTPPTLNLEYRLNGGSWTAYTYGTSISLDTGDYVEMRKADDGVGSLSGPSSSNYRKFVTTGLLNCDGNIAYLIDKTGETTSLGNYGMNLLFTSTNLENTPYFPFEVLSSGCYYQLFYGSTAKHFHFKTLGDIGYVFQLCTSAETLTIDDTTPPTIKNTTIAGLKADCIIYVPAASVAAYQAAPYWSARAAYIQAIP